MKNTILIILLLAGLAVKGQGLPETKNWRSEAVKTSTFNADGTVYRVFNMHYGGVFVLDIKLNQLQREVAILQKEKLLIETELIRKQLAAIVDKDLRKQQLIKPKKK